MGRTVGVACLVVTGILYSCYTANLSAILTASRLEPTLNDIHAVMARQDIKIGYWNNSFIGDFLTNDLRIKEHRLINLTTEDDYYEDLSRGGVDAVIDERPYMQSLVANYCSELAFAGQPFTTLNWGFVSAFYIYNFNSTSPNIHGKFECFFVVLDRRLTQSIINWPRSFPVEYCS